MTEYRLINGTIVNEGVQIEGDLVIRDDRIIGIGAPCSTHTIDIDCSGCLIIPGLIDDQVHFRQPGLTHKADIAHESRAAIAGGVTSFMEMPNTNPPTLTAKLLEEKYTIAAQESVANYGFYMGASLDNIEDIKRLKIGQAAGVKIFMGASTGNMLVDDEHVLSAIFDYAPTLIATHCENSKRIAQREVQARQQFGENIPFEQHPIIRDRLACIESSKLAMSLAEKYQAPLHILHITTKEECALFTQQPLADKLITAEACIHHLSLSDIEYDELGALMKCNPAIKSTEDRTAIRQALSDGHIDVVATDHAPHTIEEKNHSYFQAPSGLPLLQEHLPLLLELWHDGILTLERLVEVSSHAVAERYKILNRGYLRPDYYADVVVVNPNLPYTVRNHNALSKCGYSPFNQRRLRSQVQHTFVNGALSYTKGTIQPSHTAKRLQFGAQR